MTQRELVAEEQKLTERVARIDNEYIDDLADVLARLRQTENIIDQCYTRIIALENEKTGFVLEIDTLRSRLHEALDEVSRLQTVAEQHRIDQAREIKREIQLSHTSLGDKLRRVMGLLNQDNLAVEAEQK